MYATIYTHSLSLSVWTVKETAFGSGGQFTTSGRERGASCVGPDWAFQCLQVTLIFQASLTLPPLPSPKSYNYIVGDIVWTVWSTFIKTVLCVSLDISLGVRNLTDGCCLRLFSKQLRYTVGVCKKQTRSPLNIKTSTVRGQHWMHLQTLRAV